MGEKSELAAVLEPVGASRDWLRWKSGNPNVVTVDENGKITAISAGTAAVMVLTQNGLSDYAEVEVKSNPLKPTRLAVIPSSKEIEIGTSLYLNTVLTPNTAEGADTELIWSSQRDAVTVTQEGYVTAVKTGTSTVTVMTNDGRLSAITEITVIEKPATFYKQPLKLLLIDSAVESYKTINVGQSLNLTVAFLPSNLNEKPVGVSDNEKVVSVNNNTITGESAGTTDVTYFTADGTKAVCHVRVVDEPVKDLFINGYKVYEKEMKLGEELKLNITTTPADNSEKIHTRSKDVYIASVSETTVKAMGAGETEIEFYTSAGVKAIFKVSVYEERPLYIYTSSSGNGKLNVSGKVEVKRGESKTTAFQTP